MSALVRDSECLRMFARSQAVRWKKRAAGHVLRGAHCRPRHGKCAAAGTAMGAKKPPPSTPTNASCALKAEVANPFAPFLSALRSALGSCRTVYRGCGGVGMMSAMLRSFLTRSDGCAPTESQYLMRSAFSRT